MEKWHRISNQFSMIREEKDFLEHDLLSERYISYNDNTDMTFAKMDDVIENDRYKSKCGIKKFWHKKDSKIVRSE